MKVSDALFEKVKDAGLSLEQIEQLDNKLRAQGFYEEDIESFDALYKNRYGQTYGPEFLEANLVAVISDGGFVLLKYNYLTIRNATISDSDLLSKWWNDGKVMAHAGFPNGTGQTSKEIAESLQQDTDDTRRRLILERENTPIGEMNYKNSGDGIAEIGIKICDFSMQEKGYGRILLSMLIGELFSMGYKKIVLDTNLNNTRAQHVYETLGFLKIRVNIDSWKNQLGELESSIDYELYENHFINFIKLE
ncbi:MAG: GNAT family N-acetyltransferase [Mobilitalea sp.]